jgi:hypothetical protein
LDLKEWLSGFYSSLHKLRITAVIQRMIGEADTIVQLGTAVTVALKWELEVNFLGHDIIFSASARSSVVRLR